MLYLQKLFMLFVFSFVKLIFFSPYQKRLRDKVVELEISANEVGENKSLAEKLIKRKNFSLKNCKDR